MTLERLTTEERLMLDASHRWPQDIGALAVLDGRELFDDHGRFRLAVAREAFASRLHLVPRFRKIVRIPRRGRGGPFWTDARVFDIADHVRELPLEPPAGEAGLLRAVEALRAGRLDPGRPLWSVWFITGLPERRVAMYVRIHHAIADGIAAMTIVSAFMDRTPDVMAGVMPGGASGWTPVAPPSQADLVADTARRWLRTLAVVAAAVLRPSVVVRGIAAAWPATRELLAEPPGDETSIDRLVGEGRNLAIVRFEYGTVRRIGRALGASVNDVLLAASAAGLRRLFVSRGEPVEGVTVRTYVPVSLRRSIRGALQGSEIGQMAVPLSLSHLTPVERLRRIASETRRRKARPRPRLGMLFRGRLLTSLLLKLVLAQRVNVTTACIPGPARRCYLAGARVLEVFPILPLIGNQPLGIGAVSYAGTLCIGITADRGVLPDIDALVRGVRAELDALAAASEATRPRARRITSPVT
jgi:WS/DGAT/MGAT family acyltransferase